MRKDEYNLRDDAVLSTKSRLENYLDKVEELKKKKSWITDVERQDLIDRINETLTWLEEQVEKQKEVALDEDPAFRVADLDSKLKRVDALYQRLSNMPKPKDTKDGKKKKKKLPKNIKIENM